jgi:cytidylate kinase
MKASVICISHADGSNGRAVGQLAAERLGFTFADDAIVVDAADDAGLLPEAVAQAERRGAGRTLEVDFGRFESTEHVRDLIRAAVIRTAEEGNVVIVAHAASYTLSDREDVLRVLVTGSAEVRAERLAALEGIDLKQAAKDLASMDRNRADYHQRFYGVKHERPGDYDLVISTDRITPEAAAETIAAAAGL